MNNLKYIVYQSNNKIDMLKNQISGKKLEVYETEVNGKITAGILSGTIKSINQYKYLNNDIETIIRTLKNQGDIDSTGRRPYVYAEAEMLMERYDQLGCVYWLGTYYPQPDVKCVILMSGSQKNVLGFYNGDIIDGTPSEMRFYENLLCDILDLKDKIENDISFDNKYSTENFAKNIDDLIKLKRYKFTIHSSNFEFVAKVFRSELFNKESTIWDRFIRNDEQNIRWLNIVYASPLYVATIPAKKNTSIINGEKRITISESEFNRMVPLSLRNIQFSITDYTRFCEDMVLKIINDLCDANMESQLNDFSTKFIEKLNFYNIEDYGKLCYCMKQKYCWKCFYNTTCTLCDKLGDVSMHKAHDKIPYYRNMIQDISTVLYETIKKVYIIEESLF